jgi:outer membrane immunogenic protein
MRKGLLGVVAVVALASAGPTIAADMPVKGPIAATRAPVYDWTGLYIGEQVGAGWASNQITQTATGGAPNFPPGFLDQTNNGRGMLGGGYAGYNYQVNRYIIGVDGDYSWSTLKGTSTDVGLVVGPGNSAFNHVDKVEWIATAAGRLGYAVNNWMFFGRAGWAWAGFRRDSTGFLTATGALVANITDLDTRNGGTIGTGVEWGIAPSWSAKLEYDYVKFNRSDFTGTTTAANGVVTHGNASADSSLNMVKLGVAFRF